MTNSIILKNKRLPEWVSWIAQDSDGTWWGYSVEPHEHDRGWYENEVGDSLRLGQTAESTNWRSTLKHIK